MSKLPKTVTVSSGSILYLPISVDPKEPAAMTAVFAPNGYSAGGDVNLILYLHGNHTDDPKAGTPYTPSMTVEKYLGVSYFSALLDAVTASKKNLLFVAPSLGPTAQGDTILAKGIDWYLGEVLKGSQASGVHAGMAVPTLKNLVLACHSGGGRLMLALAQAMLTSPPPSAAAALRECWGFDCLYDKLNVVDIESINPLTKAKWTLTDFAPSGCEQEWRKWARTTKTLAYMHWYERKIRNQNLDKLVKLYPTASNLTVDPPFYDKAPAGTTADPTLIVPPPTAVPLNHDSVPKTYFATRLTALNLK